MPIESERRGYFVRELRRRPRLSALGLPLAALVASILAVPRARALDDGRPLAEVLEELTESDTQPRRDAAWEIDQRAREGFSADDVTGVVDALLRALDDRDPQVVWYSLLALAKVGPPAAPAVDRLARFLDDRGQDGYRAAHALGRIGRAAVPAIRAALRSDSSRVRRHAAIAASFLDPDVKGIDDVIDELIADLIDDDEDVRAAAEESLGAIGAPSVVALERVLVSDDPAVRRGAMGALRNIGEPAREAYRAILAACDDPDPGVRSTAVSLAVDLDLDPGELVPRLVRRLADADESVRDTATFALARLPASISLAPLTGVLSKEEDPVSVDAAARVLERLGSAAAPAIKPLIEAVLRDTRGREAELSASASALGAIGGPAVAPLVEALGDPRATGARAGDLASALARIGSGAVPALERALEDSSAPVRVQVAAALGRIGPPASGASAALERALGDTDPTVRAGAARALGEIGVEGTLAERLAGALDDESPEVRAGAAYALGRAATESALVIERLASVLADSAVEVRRAAATSLGQLGPKAFGAYDGLVRALDDGDAEVRRGAVNALGKIGPAAAAAAEKLVGILEESGGGIRADAAWALGQLGPIAGAVPALARALRESPPDVRLEAIGALASMGTTAEPALPDLFAVVDGGKPELVLPALRALRSVTSDPSLVVPRIAELIEKDDESLQRAAVDLVIDIGPDAQAAAPVLFRLLEDRYRRGLAFQALRAIRPRSPEILRGALDNEQRFVRVFACECVADLDRDEAEEFVPALERLAREDGDPRVRERASEALKEIRRKRD